MRLICDLCGTGDDPMHGPVKARYGHTGKAPAHFGCAVDYEYDDYKATLFHALDALGVPADVANTNEPPL